MRRWSGLLVVVLTALLAGCTSAPSPGPARTPTSPAPPDRRTCSEARPPGWVPPRRDGSKPFGTWFSIGGTEIEDEAYRPPPCSRSLHIEVDRLGPFVPSSRTELHGHHRRYRAYRVTVTNLLPRSVWFADQFRVVGFDGDRPADRAIDLRRRIGVPPSDDLALGQRVHWVEAFSDDGDDAAVTVTTVGRNPAGVGGATVVFSDR